jgi:hypothetical protein
MAGWKQDLAHAFIMDVFNSFSPNPGCQLSGLGDKWIHDFTPHIPHISVSHREES